MSIESINILIELIRGRDKNIKIYIYIYNIKRGEKRRNCIAVKSEIKINGIIII